ncbi:hypothetical protein AAHC03_024250 [Spirometra sp. Aus1]
MHAPSLLDLPPSRSPPLPQQFLDSLADLLQLATHNLLLVVQRDDFEGRRLFYPGGWLDALIGYGSRSQSLVPAIGAKTLLPPE